MTSFCQLQRRRKAFIKELVKFSCGLEYKVVDKILTYAECLLTPGSQDISETALINQMSYQFNITSSYMISLISKAVQPTRKIHGNGLTLEEYCKLICIFLTPNLDIKINFVFGMYDITGDGTLTRAKVAALLKTNTVLQTEDDQEELLKELIELVMRLVDREGNNNVDLEAFRQLVKKNVLYIELLGQCLPDNNNIVRFKQKISGKTTDELKMMFASELSSSLIGGPSEVRNKYEYCSYV